MELDEQGVLMASCFFFRKNYTSYNRRVQFTNGGKIMKKIITTILVVAGAIGVVVGGLFVANKMIDKKEN